MARLKDYYKKDVVPALVKAFDYKNPMEVPRMVKIVVNMGLGEAIQNVKILDSAVEEMTKIVRSKTGDHQGQKVHRDFQASPGHVHRLLRDLEKGTDVRILRPAGQFGAAARQGFPRDSARNRSTAGGIFPWG